MQKTVLGELSCQKVKLALQDLWVIKVFINEGLWWLIFPKVFEDFAEGSCAFGAGRELFYQQLKAIAARQEELLNLINKFSGQPTVVSALMKELLFVQHMADKIAHVLLGSDGTVDQNTSATNGFQKTLIIRLRGEDFSKINTLVQAGLYQLINIDQIPSLSSLPKEEVAGILLEAVNNAIDILEQRTAFLDEGKIGLATNSHRRTNDGDIAIRELQQGRLQILQSLY